MNDHFETQLRRALAPVDAPAGFAGQLLAKLPPRAAAAAVVVFERRAPRPAPQRFFVPAAFAASLIAAVLLGQHFGQVQENARIAREAEAGQAASRELLQALRVTSRKLDLAYQAVNNPPPADVQENRT